MPSHPDRVRRNYHTITLHEGDDPARNEVQILIRIGRDTIATALSRRELERAVWREIQKGIAREVRK